MSRKVVVVVQGWSWDLWLTYEEERPWDVEARAVELVNEEDEDTGDDEGGDELG